jgi:mono/diheme cytochrome c family protein
LPLRLALPLVLLALALAGCGTGGTAEGAEAGASGGNPQQLFVSKCGGCHELKAAGTRGTIGPSLDAAFSAPRGEGFDESSIREVVLGQMRFPIAPMPEPDSPQMFPSKDYTDEEREAAQAAIATYVSQVAANPQAIAQAQQQAGGTSASDAKGLFTQNCGGCHTLGAAGTSGQVGPNLDQISPPLARIVEQIHKGGGGMPAFAGQLTEQQIDAIAKYVFENRKS